MRRMSQEETRVSAPGSCVPGFWDGVEREIETLDVFDLIEFLGAGELPIDPAPGFRRALEARLRSRFRARFAQ